MVDHAHTVRLEDLPVAPVERTQLVIVDTSGAALAALEADGARAVGKPHDVLADADSDALLATGFGYADILRPT